MQINIDTLKAKHEKEMVKHTLNIRAQILEYGERGCDYLNGQREMFSYHRGAWNALNDLERLNKE